jgi:hypothetical protein
MPNKQKQIKFRISKELDIRLDWILLREKQTGKGELSQQVFMTAALEQWVRAGEEKWGTAPEPKMRPAMASRKQAGK